MARPVSSEFQRSRYLSIALLLRGNLVAVVLRKPVRAPSSQIGMALAISSLIRPDDTRVLFRPALFTQTLYLGACICIALILRFFFREEWMRYVLWGAWFLALRNLRVDILLGLRATRRFHVQTAWLAITLEAGPQTIQARTAYPFCALNRPFGEPSWFSAAVIPYFFTRPSLQAKVAFRSATFLHCLFRPRHPAFIAFTFALVLYGVLKRKISASLLLAATICSQAHLRFSISAFPETFNEMFSCQVQRREHLWHGADWSTRQPRTMQRPHSLS